VEEAFGNILARNCRSIALKRESAICRIRSPYSRVKYDT
jgi:hypothetical protein